MNGRRCYERFVAAMGSKYELPPFEALDDFEKAAWDAVANPNAPHRPGRRRSPSHEPRHPEPAAPPGGDDAVAPPAEGDHIDDPSS